MDPSATSGCSLKRAHNEPKTRELLWPHIYTPAHLVSVACCRCVRTGPFIFLGDYVDRTLYGCEVVLVLLLFMLAKPGLRATPSVLPERGAAWMWARQRSARPPDAAQRGDSNRAILTLML